VCVWYQHTYCGTCVFGQHCVASSTLALPYVMVFALLLAMVATSVAAEPETCDIGKVTAHLPLPESAYYTLKNGLVVCRVASGLWQLSGGHGYKPNQAAALKDMQALVDAGFITFDLADHYGPSEDYGNRRQHSRARHPWLIPCCSSRRLHQVFPRRHQATARNIPYEVGAEPGRNVLQNCAACAGEVAPCNARADAGPRRLPLVRTLVSAHAPQHSGCGHNGWVCCAGAI
jgi:hypothetical protein